MWQNVRETRWLTISLYVVLGRALGLAAGYLPLRLDVNQLVDHINRIDGYLAAQQPQPALALAPQPSGKKHGQH